MSLPLTFPPRHDPQAHALQGVRFELTSRCQLRCPSCPTGRRETPRRAVGWGAVDVDRYTRFLDTHTHIRHVEMSNYGEALLHPHFEGILRETHARAVAFSIRNGMNLNTATPEKLHALVRYGAREVTLSIDGASQHTYEQYRRGGNFQQVLDNARTLAALKKEHASPFPHIRWQFILFAHNIHELPAARALADQIGAEFVPKMSWDDALAPTGNWRQIARLTGRPYHRPTFRALERLRDNSNPLYCTQIWKTPQINWDGTLLGCCINTTKPLGNVFEQGLEGALRDPRLLRLADEVRGRRSVHPSSPCARCAVYRNVLRWRHAWKLLPRLAAGRLKLALQHAPTT